ncbi:MAG TPA: glycosyltransferase family 4 protein [Acidimicrobiia bacterium]|nr:glycosyltransferase family 4 protein [Acidimicrobiia bacterium]
MPSLLVTNDFPPKVGGIQSYLWELWRRLPPGEVTVLTTPYPGADEFDRAQPFRVVRDRDRVLLPTPALARRIDALAAEVGAGVIFLDPALPLGALGARLRSAPYVAVLHGAEVTVPGRLPGSRALLRRVLDGAAGVLAAGTYPAEEAARAAGRPLPGLVIPPGVDVDRFRPVDDDAARAATRKRYGLPEDVPVVLGVSRLVPRKGFDVLIDAVARLSRHRFPAPAASGSATGCGPETLTAVNTAPAQPVALAGGPLADSPGARPEGQAGPADGPGGPLHLAIAGRGRDRDRLARRAARAGLGDRFHLLGRVPDGDLAALYGSADVFAMCCRERWAGLEAEGFGIVFLEAAACGVPAVAGRSGGAWEAVEDGVTGFVVDPLDAGAVADALARLLADGSVRPTMGAAARTRAETAFAYDHLAARLEPLARGDLSDLAPVGGRPGPLAPAAPAGGRAPAAILRNPCGEPRADAGASPARPNPAGSHPPGRPPAEPS